MNRVLNIGSTIADISQIRIWINTVNLARASNMRISGFGCNAQTYIERGAVQDHRNTEEIV